MVIEVLHLLYYIYNILITKLLMNTKSIISFVLVLFAAVNCVVAQPYSNYLNYTVRWHWKGGSGNGLQYQHTWINYYMNGDTTINNNTYFKVNMLKKDSIVNLMFPNSPLVYYFDGYSYALREDSTKKFYVFLQNETSEHLEADFNLTVGDTFPNTVPPCFVGSVDTLFSLKRWKPQTLLGGKGVLEGIGLSGPLCSVMIEGNLILTCYSKNGNWLLIDSVQGCQTIVKPPPPVDASAITENSLEQLVMYPNPASDVLFLNHSGNSQKMELSVYDAQGNLKQLTKHSVLPSKIDISDLPKGLYIIEIRTENKIERRKFCKSGL